MTYMFRVFIETHSHKILEGPREVTLQFWWVIFGNKKENPHGMQVSMGRFPMSQFDSRDTQRPDVSLEGATLFKRYQAHIVCVVPLYHNLTAWWPLEPSRMGFLQMCFFDSSYQSVVLPRQNQQALHPPALIEGHLPLCGKNHKHEYGNFVSRLSKSAFNISV